MAIRHYKCSLLTDVILDTKSASEGQNRTLDFIPGNCFLGIVASKYAELDKEGLALSIFHGGKVKFSDAHPSSGDVRSLRMPAMFAYPKVQKRPYYLQFKADLCSEEIIALQLKQCRGGFYSFEGTSAEEISTGKSYSLKSAYDRAARRSMDGKMFGYESLRPYDGIDYYFTIESEDDALLDRVESILTSGEKHVGRSRTAQYGAVRISKSNFTEVEPDKNVSAIHTVYADGRLIFVDESGKTTLDPSAQDLGFGPDARIVWDKSQVRTFQYAPWNSKRKTFDADRLGFEKGSVFVVESSSQPNVRWIGAYQNEGFGKVIVDPRIFEAKPDGQSVLGFESKEKKVTAKSQEVCSADDSLLVRLLRKKREESTISSSINKMANQWVRNHRDEFADIKPSQWGRVREYAIRSKTVSELWDYLTFPGSGYLVHGVERWSDWSVKRLDSLIHGKDVKQWQDKDALSLVYAFASLMAKEQ